MTFTLTFIHFTRGNICYIESYYKYKKYTVRYKKKSQKVHLFKNILLDSKSKLSSQNYFKCHFI